MKTLFAAVLMWLALSKVSAAPDIVFVRNCEGRNLFYHSKLPSELQLGRAYSIKVAKYLASAVEPPCTPVAAIFDGQVSAPTGKPRHIVILLIHKLGGDGSYTAGPAMFLRVYKQVEVQYTLVPIDDFPLGSLQNSRVSRGIATETGVRFSVERFDRGQFSSEMISVELDASGTPKFNRRITTRSSQRTRLSRFLLRRKSRQLWSRLIFNVRPHTCFTTVTS